ncbi:pyruvate dehydrogenase complex dihydrolipoamide acetyltransferase [Arachidicoccus ginsenosidimutans]|uniref:pyruvate dehydrogenase complex dihydrolipoamide acetyltransferase n=1 Tax=Arachidicoccus sp. BS20 TaxID=1850526 RepID=UPI0007F0B968|nr:pyruvate dehydrogenase complex dihydrolipoamide acetyltransferase [Arachidicoccus sp. BS20]ANI89043.1 pyruvate dehydrogenase complex dihydrolipoamide acetyltransferase [Arachidicoccus sp. BS20]
MAEVIKMPRLSDTMTEGVIAAWHKKVGDDVKKGDLLAEIETDKATMELESYKDGTILYLGADNGGKLQVDDLLAIVGNKGEDISALVSGGATAPAKTEEAKPAETPAATASQPSSSIDISKLDEVVLMPRLSDTMTEGVIASWQKNVGDDVKKGDILAEIETDKATMELESYKNGKLLYQGAPAGEKIAVNDLLAIIGSDGIDVNAIVAAAKSNTSASEAEPAKEEAQTVEKSAAPAATPAPQAEQVVVNEGRILASPLAKKLASEKGIDLKYVKGSGDNGRIVKADVENYTPSAQTQAAPASANVETFATAAPAGQVSFDEIPVTQMRKTIARRLSESLFTAPHFYVTMSINMDAAVAARPVLNKDGKAKISFNDIVLKAVAVALKQHPAVNSSWLGDKIRINHHVNIGVAVAVEDGLLVPVVRFADTKSLTQISAEVKTFAQKAKDKKLQPSDWEGSTFTISNLGMFGVDEFTAIINPPDACILAVGGISQEPIVKDGQIVVGNIMKVTLSADHRVVDGATAAAFLQTLKGLLEEPLKMLL